MSIAKSYQKLIVPVFLPTLLFSASLQASLVLLPLYIFDNGFGPAVAALVVSIRGIGMLLADIPSGLLVSRLGDKKGMILGNAGNAASLCMYALFNHPVVLGLAAVLSGISFSSWLVARLSYVGEFCPPQERGRILASMAGLQRVGGIVGPALGGFLATSLGYVTAFGVLACIALIAVIVVIIYGKSLPAATAIDSHALPVMQILKSNKKVFLSAGIGAIGLTSLRGAKPLILPLFGNAIGLSAMAIGGIVSLSMIVDFLMFYPAGFAMDRWGRKTTAIPGTLFMALGLFILALLQNLTGFVAGAFLIAFGNGMATGVIMTISSDLAPASNRGQFLGVWRFICDIGFSGGPVFLTGLISILSLGTSTIILGLTSSLCAMVMWKFSPESLPKKEAELS